LNTNKLAIEKLLKKARDYLPNVYSPYSKIRVIAVLETDKGLFVGTNVENASYGLTMCAERVAFFKAISEGARGFRRILIYSPDVVPYPCGACRQVMSEFVNDDFELIVVREGSPPKIFRFSEIFPYRFLISQPYVGEDESTR